MFLLRPVLSVLILSSLAMAGSAVAGEDVPLDQLPRAVVQAIQQRFPGAVLEDAERDTEDGQPVFDVDIKVNVTTRRSRSDPRAKS